MSSERRPEEMMQTIRPGARLAVAAALVTLAWAAGPAEAYTYLETSYGSPVAGQTAKGMGMGGAMTAVSDGSFSLVQNPAMMSSEAGRVADIAMRGIRYDETRYVPIFDSFDSYVKETAVAENPETYLRINGGILWKPAGEQSRFAVAGGIYERYNAQYDFVDERRVADGRDTANRDKVQATQFITSETAIYSASGGVSYRENVLSLGASLHYYFGNMNFSNITVPGVALPESPKKDILDRDVSGVGATFGVAAEVDERVTLAVSYNLPVELDVDWRRETLTDTTLGSGTTRMPGRLGMGMAFRPQNNPRTLFSIDAARTFWESDLEDDVLEANPLINIPTIRDTWEFRAGVEHIFYNSLPARFGFLYREVYSAEEVDEAGVAFGVGYNFQAFDVGFAMDVLKRNSRQDAITPRTNVNDPKTDRVSDSLLRLAIDVRYRF